MDINLKLESTESVRIFINGKLCGEICVQQLNDIESLEAEVYKARILTRLPVIFKNAIDKLFKLKGIEDSDNKGEKARQAAFADGLVEGLQQKRIPHSYEGVPSVLPRYDKSYTIGYDYGNCLAELLRGIDQLNSGEDKNEAA